MGSVLKWIIGGIVALVLLIVIALVSIFTFVDPNDFKGQITQTVQEQTGRELLIPGDIELGIFPPTFKIGDVSMSSNKEFQGTPFLSSKLVEIKIALLPLVTSKTLKINNIGLKGVDVNLVKNNAGQTNWDFTTSGKKEKAEVQKAPAETKEPAKKAAKPLPMIDIGGITIADINVTFSDQQAGKVIKLSNFNLNVGHILGSKPFPFDANFSISIDDGKKPLNAATGITGNLALDLANTVFTIDQLKLKTDLTGAPVPVELFGLEVSAKADLGKSVVDVSDLLIKIDDTNIKGTVSINDLAQPSYKAALHIDQLDLDRYKVEKKKSAAKTEEKKSTAATTTSPQGSMAGVKEEEETPIIPVDLLQGLTFDAEVKIDKLIAAKLVTTNILVKATGKDGLVQLRPFSANLYKGGITVTGDIDARTDVPAMKLNYDLKKVELGPMFMDMKGKEEVKGTADIKAQITTQGNTKKILTRNLNGTMNISLANGEVAKLKIIDTIRVAKQIYEAGSLTSATAKKEKKVQSGKPTSFADLSATGVINSGVFKNEDLLAQSELMKITGKGTVNLNTEEIDYLLTVHLAKKLERDEEKDLVEMSDTPIPYKVTGTFDKIEQSAALKEVLKAGATKLLTKELGKRLGGDKQQGGGQQGSSSGTEDLINKGLKSLFGK